MVNEEFAEDTVPNKRQPKAALVEFVIVIHYSVEELLETAG